MAEMSADETNKMNAEVEVTEGTDMLKLMTPGVKSKRPAQETEGAGEGEAAQKEQKKDPAQQGKDMEFEWEQQEWTQEQWDKYRAKKKGSAQSAQPSRASSSRGADYKPY